MGAVVDGRCFAPPPGRIRSAERRPVGARSGRRLPAPSPTPWPWAGRRRREAPRSADPARSGRTLRPVAAQRGPEIRGLDTQESEAAPAERARSSLIRSALRGSASASSRGKSREPWVEGRRDSGHSAESDRRDEETKEGRSLLPQRRYLSCLVAGNTSLAPSADPLCLPNGRGQRHTRCSPPQETRETYGSSRSVPGRRLSLSRLLPRTLL